ncbi:3-oxoadipate enol-lactonase [Catenulispora sp. MAP12-49]|uniref:alpha/beta fold hydrolase n=1 Tax=unclassified Catenulispora TaxID=414885 RepID=UPI0035170ACD
MPSVRVRDIDVYYEIHGDGPPLVLIGGLGADLTVFAPFTELLARSFRVLTFDNRGAGRSDKPDVPYSIPMMAGDVDALMEALNLPRAHVVGVSMGGRIAIELAAGRPDRVDRLVLISTAATGTGRLRMSLPARILGLAKRLRLLPGAGEVHRQPHYAHQRQVAASTSYDGADRLDAIVAPTLILHGRRDRSVTPTAALATRVGIRDSEIEFFRGGHMFFLLTQRDGVVSRIEDFLQDWRDRRWPSSLAQI